MRNPRRHLYDDPVEEQSASDRPEGGAPQLSLWRMLGITTAYCFFFALIQVASEATRFQMLYTLYWLAPLVAFLAAGLMSDYSPRCRNGVAAVVLVSLLFAGAVAMALEFGGAWIPDMLVATAIAWSFEALCLLGLHRAWRWGMQSVEDTSRGPK